MKVIFVTGMFSTKYGGFQKFTIELAEQGVDLSIIYNANPEPQEYYEDLQKHNVDVNIVYGNIFQRAWQTYWIVNEIKPDIVHYHFGYVPYILFLLIKLLHPRIKQILTQHCEYNRNGFLWNTLTKICFRSMDCVTLVSNGVKQGLIKKIGDSQNFIVHYLGVSKKKIQNHKLRDNLHIPADDLVVTSIGFDIDVKGFDLLAQAVACLKDESIRLKVIIIGLGEEENYKYQQILSKFNVEDTILSVGIRNDVDDFLSFTDVYVQSSRTEAISLSIMEALLYGIPVIGTDVGGIPEVCIPNYNGILVERGNIKELANALQYLLKNGELRRRFGENSLSLSKKYDRKDSTLSLIQIYENLLNSK